MKPTTQTGTPLTLDRISTREELVEVMDMLTHSRILGRADGEALPIAVDGPSSEELSLDSLEESGVDKRASGELSSLTNLLLDESEWVN